MNDKRIAMCPLCDEPLPDEEMELPWVDAHGRNICNDCYKGGYKYDCRLCEELKDSNEFNHAVIDMESIYYYDIANAVPGIYKYNVPISNIHPDNVSDNIREGNLTLAKNVNFKDGFGLCELICDDCVNNYLSTKIDNGKYLSDGNCNNVNKLYLNPNMGIEEHAYSIDRLMIKYKSGEIERPYDFVLGRESSLIVESLLIRMPLMPIVLDWRDNRNVRVVINSKGLFTIFDYLDNVFCLENLDYLERLNGAFFSEIDCYLQRGIEETYVNCYIINPGVPDEVLENIKMRYEI